jgi:hypothetical protein
MAELPPGFVLEGQPAPQPGLPPGFVLEQPEPFNILPLSEDQQGNVSFDSNAGLLGAAKRFFTLPGDVATGKIDPMSDEGIGRAAEFSMFASPLNPGIRAGDRAIPGVVKMLQRPDVKPPASKTLLKEGGKGLDEIRKMPVEYSVPAVQSVVQGIRSELFEAGLREQNAKTTHGLLKDFDAEGTVATAADLMAARQAFREASKAVGPDGKPTPDAVAASRVIAGLDRFLEEPGMDAILSGPAEGVSTALRRANANYAAGKRSEKLEDLGNNAERRGEAAHSGHNIDNSIRLRLASLLEKPAKHLKGFKQSEIDDLEVVSRGTVGRNSVRQVGKLLGGGGGLGQLMSGGAGAIAGGAAAGTVGGGIGAVALPALGISATALANALTKRALGKVNKATRKRSPLYEDMQHALPLEAITPEKRAALIRTLLLTGATQE